MNSQFNNNFTPLLKKIIKEVDKYSGMTQTELFNQSINKLLKNTLKKYSDNIEGLSDFLLTREGMRVLKAITKIQKANDKKIIYENMKGDDND